MDAKEVIAGLIIAGALAFIYFRNSATTTPTTTTAAPSTPFEGYSPGATPLINVNINPNAANAAYLNSGYFPLFGYVGAATGVIS